MELHAFPQFERVAQEVGVDRPTHGEIADQAVVAIEGVATNEQVMETRQDVCLPGLVKVLVGRVYRPGGPDDAAPLRVGLRRPEHEWLHFRRGGHYHNRFDHLLYLRNSLLDDDRLYHLLDPRDRSLNDHRLHDRHGLAFDLSLNDDRLDDLLDLRHGLFDDDCFDDPLDLRHGPFDNDRFDHLDGLARQLLFDDDRMHLGDHFPDRRRTQLRLAGQQPEWPPR